MPKKKKNGKTKPIESVIGVFWNKAAQAKGVSPKRLRQQYKSSGSMESWIAKQTKEVWGKALKQDRSAKRASTSWAKALARDRNR
jgi:hypothetical protein